MRRALSLFGIVMLVAVLGAAVARADSGPGTTTTGTTDTTTTDATTTETTTTQATTTTAPTYAPLYGSSLPHSCIGAGVAAIANRDGSVVALTLPHSGFGASKYPASHPYLTLDSATASGSGCSSTGVRLTNVRLFGGAVTATSVTATAGHGRVTRLEVNGSLVSAAHGQTVAVGGWGLLELGATSGRLSAPIALRLRYGHDSVPAGTTIYVGFAAQQAKAPPRTANPSQPHHHQPKHHKKHPNGSGVPQPLTATPPLGINSSQYVFPVDTGASYIDTYGAGRNDIYDGWHHGDDLFAPLGTPVVAVADGKLTLVGWNELGGWRLWLTDKKGNSFYYAHLAGYSALILHNRTVKAGQVMGFLGRTGDAFPTPPHLHFEVHPHQLVRLGYDGAVDPTTYLHSWRVEHLPTSQIPPAARLRAPAGTPSQEAAVVWGELLKARHLMPDGEPAVAETPSVRRPFPATKFIDARNVASSRLGSDSVSAVDGTWMPVALGVALAALAIGGSFVFLRRRRSTI
jgi:murein DD-endopeptidase MepM/ murein hydrolase activator NlpD